MVFCRYCGEKNEDGNLKCSNCGKTLSLLPYKHQRNSHNDNSNFNEDIIFNRISKPKYSSNLKKNNQNSIKTHYQTDFNPNDRNRNEKRFNDSLKPKYSHYDANGPYGNKKARKNFVEWDVVIATALLVIILSSIFQRVFPAFGLFLALLIGLIYILIATKSKSSLIKAIPLAIIMVLTISAYFVL